MLTHSQIWAAIDALAAAHGMSASGLARRAGLDPTTFNKSKRLTVDGRQRWPSTESIAKVLMATGSSLDGFVALVTRAAPPGPLRLPLIASKPAARLDTIATAQRQADCGWSEIALSAVGEATAFVLELDGGCTTTLFAEGDLLVVLPDAPYRRGDRLVVRMATGALAIGELKRETADSLELTGTSPDRESALLMRSQISWIGRIHWASQ